MKKLLSYLLFCTLPVFAQDKLEPLDSVNTRLYCFDTELLFKQLRETYNEYPLIYGIVDDSVKSKLLLWVNSSTNDWTLVATKDKLSCVIGAGSDLKVIPLRKKIL